MQLSGDIRRRHNNGKRLLALSFAALGIGMEILVVQPFLIQFFLNGRRIVILFQFFHDHFLSVWVEIFIFMAALLNNCISSINKESPPCRISVLHKGRKSSAVPPLFLTLSLLHQKQQLSP